MLDDEGSHTKMLLLVLVRKISFENPTRACYYICICTKNDISEYVDASYSANNNLQEYFSPSFSQILVGNRFIITLYQILSILV